MKYLELLRNIIKLPVNIEDRPVTIQTVTVYKFEI